ncbi:MAG TPA: M3 family metallopeptidase, partial [Thermomicrobiales bacterium]|nr:M3 family metallopeptidase [Thermomicrobiales bacterium]
MSIAVAEKTLPTWDMTTIYPAIDSPEYVEAVSSLSAGTARLEALLDAALRGGEDMVATFEQILGEVESAFVTANRLIAFVTGHIAVDSRDQLAQARMSELRIQVARLSKSSTRFTAWIGTLDVEDLIARSDAARANAFVIRKAKIDSGHLMSPVEEDLAADLGLSGGRAWTQMYDDVTSQIAVPMENAGGETESLPMTEIRNLAMSPDRETRRRAWEAELAAWKQWETPIAAALNGIKGEHITVSRRRQWDSVLDEALHRNHIDRMTLDAMMDAARDAFPDFRRYFCAKAKALGIPELAWYDLFAPPTANEREWPWDEAIEFVFEQFGTYSWPMRELAERSVSERWIDVAPRPGKVGGAFCMAAGLEESRVLLNFTPAFDGVSTLAHELGHAYHNLCQVDTPVLQRMSTPMTLAETASTFCETILRKAAIATGTEDEAFSILEGSL